MAEATNAIFRQLKGPCVALNQAALSFQGRNAPPALVVHCAEDLLRTLRGFKAGELNSRLAEYAFVPLSYILKSSQLLPVRASEIAFECLSRLLEVGWQEQVAGPLGSQLLILLGITADRSSKVQNTREPTEQLLQAVFDCLYYLFFNLERTKAGRSQLQDASVVPHLGHAVTVILDGIVSDNSSEAQNKAAQALEALVQAVNDHEMLASFLPGIVSSLTKVLTPSTKVRRTGALLQRCLRILTNVFRKTVSSQATAKINPRKTLQPFDSNQSRPLDSSWLEATSGQLKLALANINRLRTHSRVEVRKALIALDLTIVNDCGDNLPNCRPLCIESLVVLLEDDHFHDLKAQVETLVQTNPKVLESLETTLHDWTISLPRILEGSDEDKKTLRLQQMFTAYSLLQESAAPTQSMQHLISASLPEYVAIVLRTTGQDKTSISEAPAVRLENLPLALRTDRTMSFPDAVSSSRFQTDILGLLRNKLSHLASSDLAVSFASQVRESTHDMQVSAMWLSLNLVRAKQDSSIADFLSVEEDIEPWREHVLDDLYEFSLTTIELEDADWRLKALSLEAIATQTTALGDAFRNELIDVLYPILHLLGGDSPRLRQHAMVCLNIITQACGFADVRELVVDNADYLVNAVALKLNSFDVSPQGPQVLLMMINLAGPSLIPYLEDTVESIFAVLEDYHGYTTLVELLFSVLSAISSQAAQEPQLQLPAPSSADSYPSLEWEPISIPSLALFLKKRKNRTPPPISNDLPPPDSTTEPPDDPPSTTITLTKTQTLLLRLFTSTQHHLPTSSPSLRLLLLTQLSTLTPLLARHEDSFLPAVATLWPSLVSRLSDPEPHVVRATLDVLTALAKEAGGFLRSRVRELWGPLRGLHVWISAGEAGSSAPAASSRAVVVSRTYVDPSFAAVRKAFGAFLVAAATRVGVEDEAFGEMLGWLGPVEGWDRGDREALERVNGDAVWVARWRGGEQGVVGRIEGGIKWATA